MTAYLEKASMPRGSHADAWRVAITMSFVVLCNDFAFGRLCIIQFCLSGVIQGAVNMNLLVDYSIAHTHSFESLRWKPVCPW